MWDCAHAAFLISRLDRASPLLQRTAEATLADGTRLACVLGDQTRKGFLRIDAVDQDNYYWFWLEVTAMKRNATVVVAAPP